MKLHIIEQQAPSEKAEFIELLDPWGTRATYPTLSIHKQVKNNACGQ